MNEYRIIVAPEAEEDLRELYAYIELHSTHRTAKPYILRLRSFCQSLAIAPNRGDRIAHRPELRSLGFEDRVRVIFAVFDKDRIVEVEGFDYGGRQRW